MNVLVVALNQSFVAWAGSASEPPALESLAVATLGAGGDGARLASAAALVGADTEHDQASATRLMKRTKQMVVFGSAFVGDDVARAEARRFAEKLIVDILSSSSSSSLSR